MQAFFVNTKVIVSNSPVSGVSSPRAMLGRMFPGWLVPGCKGRTGQWGLPCSWCGWEQGQRNPAPELPAQTRPRPWGLGVGKGASLVRVDMLRSEERGTAVGQPKQQMNATLRATDLRPTCGFLLPSADTGVCGSTRSHPAVSVLLRSRVLVFAFPSHVQVVHDPVTETDPKAWARVALWHSEAYPCLPLSPAAGGTGANPSALSTGKRGRWLVVVTKSRLAL